MTTWSINISSFSFFPIIPILIFTRADKEIRIHGNVDLQNDGEKIVGWTKYVMRKFCKE